MVLPLFARKALCILLALVCAFSFLTVPVRAVALSTGVIVGISAVLAVGAALAGLGVAPKADDQASFDTLCSNMVALLPDTWKFTNTAGDMMIKALQVGSSYFFQQEFLADVLSLVFSTGAVQNLYSPSKPAEPTVLFNGFYNYALSQSVQLESVGINSYVLWTWTDGTAVAYLTKTLYDLVPDSEGYMSIRFYKIWYFDAAGNYRYGYNYSDGRSDEVRVGGCVAGAIALAPVSDTYAVGNLAENLAAPDYDTWRKTEIIEFPQQPGGDDDQKPEWDAKKYLGISIAGGLGAYVATATQAWVQSGGQSTLSPDDVEETDEKVDIDIENSPGADQLPDVDTSTNPDAGTNPDSSGSGSGGGSITNSTDVTPDRFKLDLRTLFPFCIPFDLYAMLNALNAEPETPVFTMGIPFAGQIYTFTVDLEAWNSIAAILRTCQVALFCVGLTQATRKYIKW